MTDCWARDLVSSGGCDEVGEKKNSSEGWIAAPKTRLGENGRDFETLLSCGEPPRQPGFHGFQATRDRQVRGKLAGQAQARRC